MISSGHSRFVDGALRHLPRPADPTRRPAIRLALGLLADFVEPLGDHLIGDLVATEIEPFDALER